MSFEKMSRGKTGVQHPGKAIPLCPHLPRDLNNENKVLTVFEHCQDISKGRSLRTPQEGTINALLYGDSGSVAVVPNSGTLSAGIETMKKPAKQFRLCLAAGVACMGAGDCDRARHAAAAALEAPLSDRGAGLRFSPEQRVRL